MPEYIAALEAGCDQLLAAGITANVRGNHPPNIGSFLFATSPRGAVEISIDADVWFIEFWRSDNDDPTKEAILNSLHGALDAASEWLLAD